MVVVARLLLRVRLLYYLKQEMIGSEAEKVLCGAPARLYDTVCCLMQYVNRCHIDRIMMFLMSVIVEEKC